VVTKASEVAGSLSGAGVGRGDPVAVAHAAGAGLALVAPTGHTVSTTGEDAAEVVRRVEAELRPRWVWWSGDTAAALVASGARVAACWDIAAVHRLLSGGWRADPGRVWATLRDLPLEGVPAARGQPDLFSSMDDGGGSADGPVRPDGYLRPDWSSGGWSASPDRLVRWAELAAEVARWQHDVIAAMPDNPRLAATARVESAAELLCAEMSADGLPLDRTAAEAIIEGFVGPRPRTEREAAGQRGRRDAEVLRHAPAGSDFDLRSPGQVKSLLRRIGVEVPDTRAWRLEARRDEHPLVDALLTWRKAERVSTTFGYGWLDEHLGDDGRLRGEWSGSDGAAGRMTASAGLHNMPADLRGGVAAEDGHVLVRADLGQIEPRVLAAVSGDRDLARATAEDDMYSPVARQLDVDRATAKVAVLGAMYGQTTGHGAHALRRLQMAYPVAMAYLDDADRAGQTSRDLRTYGGRLIPMGSTNANDVSDTVARSRAAARGRYGRNAMVQGAAAELFKLWAVTVRARGAALDARIVLCLHDELLVHTPTEHGDAVARLLDDCLQEAAIRWAPDRSVRFVADISVLRRWSEAKD
jgi:DNA polymerase-1